MGQLTNATDEDLDVPAISRSLGAGETVDVDDAVLSANMFAHPTFQVNGRKRVGPFEDVEDYSNPSYLAADDQPPIVQPDPPVAPENTE